MMRGKDHAHNLWPADRLWNEYGKALRAYSHAEAAVAELPHARGLWQAVKAHKAVATCRRIIRNHCL